MSILKPTQGVAHAIKPFHFSAMGSAEDEAPAHSAAPNPSSDGQPAPSKEPSPEVNERLTMARRITELEDTLKSKAAEAEKAITAAREEGRIEGREEAEKKDAERLAAFEETLKLSRSDTLKALETQRSLAIDIARATLQQILGDQSAFTGLVSETAAYWKAKLAGAAILKVRVSESDFSDPLALQQLHDVIGNLEIDIDGELAPGACIFSLQLGEVNASIPLQAERADAMLSEYTVEVPAQ